jgi:hypothetical protein
MESGQRFLVHQWPDGYAVFDQSTGDTHALDLSAGAGFFAAQAGNDPYESIEKCIRSLYPDEMADAVIALANSCFERLERCGLFEPQKSH